VQEHLFELYGNVQNARASEIQFIGHDLVKDRTVPTSQFFAEGEGTEWTEQGGNFISFRRVPNSDLHASSTIVSTPAGQQAGRRRREDPRVDAVRAERQGGEGEAEKKQDSFQCVCM